MREHEVPTHVQAEDRVLLWFTFPQIVAMTAVCALAYGVYRYAPFGPSEVRMAAAVLFGLAGLAVVAGRIGGRRLPLVAADLLRFGLGARRYAGPPAQLVRSEPPAPAQPASGGPRPRRLLARRMRRVVRRRSRRRKEGERRNGRMPFRPHRLFGKRRRQGGEEPAEAQRAATQERDGRRLGRWRVLPAVAVMAVVLTALPVLPALAQDPGEEGWFSEEIEFQPPPLVQGRRLFVEGLAVSGEQAAVTLRAATDLDLTVRAYGGPEGRSLRFFGTAALDQGELSEYDLPLHGPAPSLVFSWEDELGQAGAVSLAGERLPYPLPAVTGELCIAARRLARLERGSRRGGRSASECVSTTEEAVALQTVAGHADVTHDGGAGRPRSPPSPGPSRSQPARRRRPSPSSPAARPASGSRSRRARPSTPSPSRRTWWRPSASPCRRSWSSRTSRGASSNSRRRRRSAFPPSATP